MRQHYERIIRDTDKRVAKSLKIQIKDRTNKNFGGFVNPKGLIEAKFAAYRVVSMIAAFCNKESKYYNDETVSESVLNGLEYIKRVQHESGLFDYIDCNFESAPDTAFIVKKLLPAARLMHDVTLKADMTQQDDTDLKDVFGIIYYELSDIIKEAANGLKLGGFHTPNHRWAIASNLMDAGDFLGDKSLYDHAQKYLNEGIDCNEDGEFAERSTGNYNRINNDAMITLATFTGDDKYFEYARKNMDMMLTYIEPDGSIFTMNSTRQDKGNRIYPKDYYLQYLRMGIWENNSKYLGYCNFIFDLIDKYNLSTPDILVSFMLDPDLIECEYSEVFEPKEYKAFYKESKIARVRHDEFSFTIMAGVSNFLYFSGQNMDFNFKIGGSFCEHRAFVPETIEKIDENTYYLKQVMKGWYYLPFEEPPQTSDWWKMDHSLREKKYGPDITIEVYVREIWRGLEIEMKAYGVENAPFRLEISESGANTVKNDNAKIPATAGNIMISGGGYSVFETDESYITVGTGFAGHEYINGKFGSEAVNHERFTLYYTDFIPFERKVTIVNGD